MCANDMCRCRSGATTIAVWLHAFITIVAASAAAAGSNEGAIVAQAPADDCQWWLHGAGYHMQFAVEFPLHYEEVEIFFELPKTFFFDVDEAKQMYTITATNGVDLTDMYTSLHINSTFFFDIEAPVFHVAYEVNNVRFAFMRLQPKATAAAKQSSAGKGLLLLPIHARYEEADVATPFSLQAFFNRESVVRRCIPSVAVHDAKTTERCHTLPAPPGERIESPSGTLTTKLNRPSSCQDVPVPLLLSLPVVYIFLIALQCVGAAVVVFSLLWV
ncbi:hypothetical protein TraAM80_03977 [Trypanosoma rangeli]|uniref:Uncharacterized protein n=1 Tax=Trypanosoma rangeli TaxID=5698 RepID=A0A422NM30_TRYRA|nr:uncharacterized protein TraAM80_03977 [Trypanosoma rangeli]RNF06558.1 hypothetical protein TraAM80_03977 [Trypanosoma rangeli]|eukprot:RNF06558.1 hypothetical protein TraAM80_03977 [Trypanosoma rangeli]